jgi:TetR/AcrR family acrAB operon transcriptional repressor
MGRPKKNKEINKEILLEAALEEFSEKGYHKTKLEDIAKRAGVSRGAIYWHFKDKNDFYTSLVKSNFIGVEEKLGQILESDLSNKEKLENCYINYFKFLVSDPRLKKLRILENRKAETWTNIDLKEHYDNKLDYWVNLISKVIQSGIEKKEFNPAIESKSTALSFLFYIIGAEEIWLFHKDSFNVEVQLKNSIDIFINGIKL